MARSMLVNRKSASASLGVAPYQNPQRFSRVAYPWPLKKACCKLSVLSRVNRSVTFTVCRGSIHLVLLTMGMKGYGLPSHVTQSFQLRWVHARDSSRG